MKENKKPMYDDMMEQVNGGYLLETHAISEADYNACDIKTDYHWFEKDEFWLPDGTKVDEDGANNYIISNKGQDTFDKLSGKTSTHAGKIR